MDRNGNADVLPPLKSSTKGNVKAQESNVSGALPLVGGLQVQQLFEEETNQQNKGKVANEIQGLPSVNRPVSYSGNTSPASGRRSSLNGSGSLKSRGLPMVPEQAMKLRASFWMLPQMCCMVFSSASTVRHSVFLSLLLLRFPSGVQ